MHCAAAPSRFYRSPVNPSPPPVILLSRGSVELVSRGSVCWKRTRDGERERERAPRFPRSVEGLVGRTPELSVQRESSRVGAPRRSH